MRRFLYFFSEVTGANPQMLRARGVLDRFNGAGGAMIEHGVTVTPIGPNGRSGCIVAAGAGPAGIAAFNADVQRWLPPDPERESVGVGAWVGMDDVKFPPRPQDLERSIGISGPELRLGDGNLWRVPLVRRWDRMDHVPCVPRALAREGSRIVEKVSPEYQAVDELAGWVLDAFIAETAISVEELFAKAILFLAVNYRIGMEEAALLGLLSRENAISVLRAAADLDAVEAQARDMAFGAMQIAVPRIEEE